MAFPFDVVRFNYEAMAELVALAPELRKAQKADLAEFIPGAAGWNYEGALDKLHGLAYASGLMDPFPKGFDYQGWTDKAQAYFEDPSLVASMKAGPLRQIFFYVVRGERFCSGHIFNAWRKGLLVPLLERIAKVHARKLAAATR